MHATEIHAEAARLMTVCNSCRYCEGICPVFPAMELRRVFTDSDLDYLANLCHNCGACYADCQFSPPHEFDVNVPATLARLRNDSFAAYVWPRALQPVFARNGLLIALSTALGIASFLVGLMLAHDPGALWRTSGSFYTLMPHNVMAGLFVGIALFAALAMIMSARNFWVGARAPTSLLHAEALAGALGDVLTLRHLDGGGEGCYGSDLAPDDRRRLYHHLTFYGFLLCFAATGSGTILHYGFDWPAPYGLFDLPKLLGIPGGLLLMAGTMGLFAEKLRRDAALYDHARRGMDMAFIVLLFLTAFSGLALMLLRETPIMGIGLALHLGIVAALFLSLPYSKFMHAIYRSLALYRARLEQTHVTASQKNQETSA